MQFGKAYVMHFVNLFKIKGYGNRNVGPAADMTISKALVVSSTNAN